MAKDSIARQGFCPGAFVRIRGISVKDRKVLGISLQEESSIVLCVLLIFVKCIENYRNIKKMQT
jgi:hypothetical protein